ncbi:SEC-C metal-binding domain-containing protein [Paramagnetospirillum magneticum]|uniref:Uncharacterized protein n=1 Tax=Paramagnetospirillum magneticum (strain ATCC 700264 / AMB-1) TaxID=342108 RepID=Q2W0Q9_PARM1|nr:hypothetical protein amb3762 [Paramagnetospirillum magneticum AMB-1]
MKVGRKQRRNDRCACGSGRKYKECSLIRDAVANMLLNQLDREGRRWMAEFLGASEETFEGELAEEAVVKG